MGRILAIVNQKGGVGKTTTAVNLASSLARRGRRVILIDLDPQANATSGLGLEHTTLARGSYQALTGAADWAEVAVPTVEPNLTLVPATADLVGANVELVPLPRREYVLADRLGPLADQCDHLLIDCPPSLGLLTINALTASHEVLIPVQCEYFALEGLGQLLETLRLVKERLNPRLTVRGAVLTMYETRSQLARSVHQQLYEFFPYAIFRTVIPRSVQLAEAPSFGQPILGYAPWSTGARAYRRLAVEFLHQEAA